MIANGKSTGRTTFHEDFSRDARAGRSSDRGFGMLFAVFCGFLFAWRVIKHHDGYWLLALSACFAVTAFLKPSLLRPLNTAWTRLGMLLGRVVNPIVVTAFYFVAFVPLGIVFRLTGKDPLRLRFRPDASTYWIERRPPGPPPDTMIKQF